MIALTGATASLATTFCKTCLTPSLPARLWRLSATRPKPGAQPAGRGCPPADYSDEAALTAALQGVDKLLLISSSEVGQRAVQHRNVINAAKAAGVKFIAYTSLLHADTSPLGLAAEHIETEQMLADSGIAYALLRNGWYTENYQPARRRWSMACLSAPPARVKSPPPPARIMPPLPPALSPVRVMKAKFTNWRVITPDAERPAAELSKQSGKNVVYQNLSEADFAAALKASACRPGLPICWRIPTSARRKADCLTTAAP